MAGFEEPKPSTSDPDALTKALEIELMLKRAVWKKTSARRGTWRALSILFLVLVVLGTLAAYFFFASEFRPHRETTPRPGTVDSTR